MVVAELLASVRSNAAGFGATSRAMRGSQIWRCSLVVALHAASLSLILTTDNICVHDPAAKGHRCTDNCPICNVMSPDNSLQLLPGTTSIELGILDLVIETAQIGYRMCLLFCAVWQVNQEVCEKTCSGFCKTD